MMRTGLFSSLFCLLVFSLAAQNFPIGYQTMNFTDPARSNRPVPAEVYYPGLIAGNNAALANGKFSVISFGHGFHNFICSIGEVGCSSSFTITRDQQHDAVIDFLVPSLDYYLKKIPLSWTIFNDSLLYSQRITHMKSCIMVDVVDPGSMDQFVISPNPVHDKLTLATGRGQERVAKILLRSHTGSVVLTRYEKDEDGSSASDLDLSFCKAGAYFLEITGRNGMTQVFRLIKV